MKGLTNLSREDLYKIIKKLEHENNDLRAICKAHNVLVEDPLAQVESAKPKKSRKGIGGRYAMKLTDENFKDRIRDKYRHKSDVILGWLKSKIELLKSDQSKYTTLKGNKRLVAPLYVAIKAGVFVPASPEDIRPYVPGTAIEQFFGLPGSSYKNYSTRWGPEPPDIARLYEDFRSTVLAPETDLPEIARNCS